MLQEGQRAFDIAKANFDKPGFDKTRDQSEMLSFLSAVSREALITETPYAITMKSNLKVTEAVVKGLSSSYNNNNNKNYNALGKNLMSCCKYHKLGDLQALLNRSDKLSFINYKDEVNIIQFNVMSYLQCDTSLEILHFISVKVNRYRCY
jgi:hypothetical protein